jgi:hypothetical protein
MTSAKSSSEFVAAKTEELARTETELLEMFRKSNQEWSERLQTEMKLLSELGAKLNAARSIPELAAAYQSYASQRVAMASEDARHLFEDYQTLARIGARLWTTNWPVPPSAGA